MSVVTGPNIRLSKGLEVGKEVERGKAFLPLSSGSLILRLASNYHTLSENWEGLKGHFVFFLSVSQPSKSWTFSFVKWTCRSDFVEFLGNVMRKSSITTLLVGAPMRDNHYSPDPKLKFIPLCEIEMQWPVNLATLLRILDFLRRFSHRDITVWITNSRKLRELSDILASRAGDKLGSVTWRNLLL